MYACGHVYTPTREFFKIYYRGTIVTGNIYKSLIFLSLTLIVQVCNSIEFSRIIPDIDIENGDQGIYCNHPPTYTHTHARTPPPKGEITFTPRERSLCPSLKCRKRF